MSKESRRKDEFSRKVKALAFKNTKRIDGKPRCDGCQAELVPGQITYDHIKTVEEGGDGSLSNCQVLCRACDDVKTYVEDIPRIRKGDRQRDKHSGAFDVGKTGLEGRNRATRRLAKSRRSQERSGGESKIYARRSLYVEASR